MRGSLFSSSWYRVAGLKLRLRSHAQIHRHLYRGEVWYLLQDHASGQFHRFTPTANVVVGLLNGQRTMQEIWEIACDRLGDDVPSQDEIISLISQLHKADVLQGDITPDIGEVEKRKVAAIRNRIKQYFKNPLSLRFPLVDPDRLLNLLTPLVRPFFSWFGAIVWLLVVGASLGVAATHWNELTENVVDNVFATENLVIMWFVYPLVKLFHEFGHAFATKVRQGEVHEMGVMLLVLVPVPYVDATAATGFRSKWQRALVGSSGMMFEIFLAALAMFFWADAQPGVARAFAYNVILIAGVSTLVFNINPLLRFDGYYILSDLIEIPNLGARANQYFGYLLKRYVLRVKKLPENEDSAAERAWFLLYSIGSFIYRMMVLVSIVLLVASKFFFVGVLLACWSGFTGLVQPVMKQMQYLATSAQLAGRRILAVSLVAAFTLGLGYLLFFVPFPSMTTAEGVVWPPEQSHVRAAHDCIIEQVMADSQSRVSKDQPLLVCSDPEQQTQVHAFEAQLEELQAKKRSFVQAERVQTQIINEEIAHITARIKDARRKVAKLVIRSPEDGQFMIQQAEDFPGRFVRRGDLLAYVVNMPLSSVRVLVRQNDIDLVRGMTTQVEIRPIENIAEVIPARVRRAVPAATDKLPSPAFSLQGGGQISLDPSKPGDQKTLEGLFVFDIDLQAVPRFKSIGSRVYVRFQHRPEPLGLQWYRSIRQILLKKFNV